MLKIGFFFIIISNDAEWRECFNFGTLLYPIPQADGCGQRLMNSNE